MRSSKGAWLRLRVAAGVQRTLPTNDRRVLEDVIFPRLLEPDCQRILFVGCDWYTRCYNEVFADREYWTIEIDPAKRRYGSINHIVAGLEDIENYFAPGYFDAIVCNGVFGWGLNDRDAVERAFAGCLYCLREGGLFILGWNDIPERRPFPLEECQALQQFERYTLPALGMSDHRTDTSNRHTFSFYRRPETLASPLQATTAQAARFDLASFVSTALLTLHDTPLALLACA